MRISGKGLSGAAGLLWVWIAGAACAQVNITTYHYDNLRTGWNQKAGVLHADIVLHAKERSALWPADR
ncbi:MAG TPA: hypothetical protein VHX61_18665 [Rhizomicrobium sp.]|jgi:hypothetical protein|nr:hypothetical protein [Rhizomicrobium sp.]